MKKNQLEYDRDRRKNAFKKGMCARHVDTPALSGRTCCQECVDYKKVRTKEAKKHGFCIRHWGIKAVKGQNECLKCKAYTREKRDEARKAGICLNCYTNKVTPFKTVCSFCSLLRKLTRLKNGGLHAQEIKKAKQAVNNFKNSCECCGSKNPRNKYGEFSLDHDHKKLVFRGIICQSCNLCLGHVKDSIDHLKKIIRYLKITS